MNPGKSETFLAHRETPPDASPDPDPTRDSKGGSCDLSSEPEPSSGLPRRQTTRFALDPVYSPARNRSRSATSSTVALACSFFDMTRKRTYDTCDTDEPGSSGMRVPTRRVCTRVGGCTFPCNGNTGQPRTDVYIYIREKRNTQRPSGVDQRERERGGEGGERHAADSAEQHGPPTSNRARAAHTRIRRGIIAPPRLIIGPACRGEGEGGRATRPPFTARDDSIDRLGVAAAAAAAAAAAKTDIDSVPLSSSPPPAPPRRAAESRVKLIIETR
jgi:hypothetical protein